NLETLALLLDQRKVAYTSSADGAGDNMSLISSAIDTMLASSFPALPLGSLLERSSERIDIQSNETYRQVTVKLWGKGVVLRSETLGVDMANSRLSVIRPDQLILSRIDARNGAIGIVPSELDGAVVSNDFPAFNFDRAVVIPAFMGWLTKSTKFIAQ